MGRYICRDECSALVIDADSDVEAAQEFANGFDQTHETQWASVHVTDIPDASEMAALAELIGSRLPSAKATVEMGDMDGPSIRLSGDFDAEQVHEALSDERICFVFDFDETTSEITLDLAYCERGNIKVEIEPVPPRCVAHNHDWRTPYSLLGGLRENPGVRGHGGGVVMRSVCRHCGIYRVVDTWAQDPVDGEQGLTSVTYLEADDSSLEWLAEGGEE